MTNCKGTNLTFLHKLLQTYGPPAVAAFDARLTPEQRAAFATALPVSWVPVDLVAAVFEAAAAVVHPNDPEGVRKLGRALAEDNLAGIYQSLLKLATIPFAIGQVALLWRIYQDHGRAHAAQVKGENRAVLTVEEYEDLPVTIQEEIAGYVIGVGEMVGAKNIHVVRDGSDPSAWKWTITWN
jgi:hypothetical protein